MAPIAGLEVNVVRSSVNRCSSSRDDRQIFPHFSFKSAPSHTSKESRSANDQRGRQFRSMDRTTVDRLVVEHLPAALRFAHRLTGDANVAEDVVQEALCRVLHQWRSYREQASFGTWLLQVVLNVDRDRRRRLRAHATLGAVQLKSGVAEPSEQAMANEQQAKLQAAIDSLPERQREVAILCLGEGLAAHEVARILEITTANVHTSLHLARKRMAKAIGWDNARRRAK
jgi:RNA polymerase sigma-70 factor (ECF subfamily)